jgi:hypothetical protein
VAEVEPVDIQLSGAAQIILALLLGLAAVLRALAVFLPAWRDKKNNVSS